MNKSPVTLLEELINKTDYKMQYLLLPSESLTAHRPIFHYSLNVGPFQTYGKGFSKKQAKHDAARKALKLLPEAKSLELNEGSSATTITENLVGLLNEVCFQNNLPKPEYEILSNNTGTHVEMFIIECKVGSLKRSGTDKNKKIAKHLASKNMLEAINNLSPDNKEKLINEKALANSPKRVHDLINCLDYENMYPKRKKPFLPVLISNYPETLKNIMLDKNLTYDDIWNGTHNEDYDTLKKIIYKLGLKIAVDFMLGKENSAIAIISINTKPEFSIGGWGVTKRDALDASMTKLFDFLKIMTK